MTTISLLSLILMCVSTSVGWTRSDHWQIAVTTSRDGSVLTSSIAVYPTASVSATSTNTSTTLVSGSMLDVEALTYQVTVTDLFYPPGAPVCLSNFFGTCGPTPTFAISGSITTNYYAPVVVSNPSSCTKTSFLYTTSQTIFPEIMISSIPDVIDQATGSAEALLVTTYVVTLSTNLGGQAVTTSVCDVYLKGDAVLGLVPYEEEYPLSQCVDPRAFSCSVSRMQIPTVACQITSQVYPTTGQKNGGAGGLTPSAFKIWVLLMFPSCVLLFGLLY
jgi:hypothetical protein